MYPLYQYKALGQNTIIALLVRLQWFTKRKVLTQHES